MNTIGQRETLSRTGTPAGPSAMVLSRPHGENSLASYAYDAFSRLISRSVGVSPTTATAYIYDGWNRIAEYTVTPGNPNVTPPTETVATLSKTYLWGLDMSGSFQGAGGVGGLLSVNTIGGSIHYPTYDGNGNITEYLTAAGDVTAHFEYDPFGNTVVSTDTTNQFEYRFSTKPQDPATGLLYYGYRWYDPLTGRWPSRDPIEEEGGANLYGFGGNDGVSTADLLGLDKILELVITRDSSYTDEMRDHQKKMLTSPKDALEEIKDICCKEHKIGCDVTIVVKDNLGDHKDSKMAPNGYSKASAPLGEVTHSVDAGGNNVVSIPILITSKLIDNNDEIGGIAGAGTGALVRGLKPYAIAHEIGHSMGYFHLKYRKIDNNKRNDPKKYDSSKKLLGDKVHSNDKDNLMYDQEGGTIPDKCYCRKVFRQSFDSKTSK